MSNKLLFLWKGRHPLRLPGPSRAKKETVILSDTSLDREAVKRTIAGAGYTPLSVAEETAGKKGFFHFGRSWELPAPSRSFLGIFQ